MEWHLGISLHVLDVAAADIFITIYILDIIYSYVKRVWERVHIWGVD